MRESHSLFVHGQPKQENILENVLLSVFLFVAESLLLIQPFSVWMFILLHSFLTGMAIIYVVFLGYLKKDQRFAILLVLFLGAMGPFGAGLCLVTLLLYQTYRHMVEGDLLEALWPEIIHEKREILYERLLYGAEEAEKKGGELSFQDIMAFGNEKQKRTAIEKILKHFRPEFFPALFMGLNDRQNSVRIYAATAMTSLDKQFFDKYLVLRKLVQENPADSKALWDLAHHCEMYANSRILDTAREEKMHKDAIEAYEKYAKERPEDLSADLPLARLYLDINQPMRAKQWLEPLIVEKNPPPEVYLTWMRILFDLKDYEALRQLNSTEIMNHYIHNQGLEARLLDQFLMLWHKGMPLALEEIKHV